MFVAHYYPLLRLRGLLSPRSVDPVEAGWTLPNPNDADFNQLFYEGNTLPIAWTGWPASSIDNFLHGANPVDLWITSFDYNQTPYNQLLTSRLCKWLTRRRRPGLCLD
jgi:hypothetical protein